MTVGENGKPKARVTVELNDAARWHLRIVKSALDERCQPVTDSGAVRYALEAAARTFATDDPDAEPVTEPTGHEPDST